MSNYKVQSYNDTYTIYELTEANTASRIRVCPERGGIVIGCKLHGLELFYLDQSTFENAEANIRGGNPILFPICGQLENRTYEWKGASYQMAQHGFARTSAWTVVSTDTDGEASITLSLRSSEETRAVYPFDFELIFTYALKDGELHTRQQYRNLSQEPMPFYAGFHPYFLTDTKSLDYTTDATRYLDYNDMVEKPFPGQFDLAGMVESVTLLDPIKNDIAFPVIEGARVRLSYDDHFKYVVLWSVENRPFVCVEPWMAMAGELNRQEELVILEAGTALDTNLIISCER